MLILNRLFNHYGAFTRGMVSIAQVLPPLALRLLLAWEFGESGYEKLTGENWFSEAVFPFPFSLLPPDYAWDIATWLELAGATALILGCATRLFSLLLIILTLVAIAVAHWPEHWDTVGQLLKGYRIIDADGDGFGNYKLPLIFIVMFLPLLFGGAGRLSLDYWLKRKRSV